MARRCRRKKTIISPPCDRISDLPVSIIETILMCLPLREAVRTSILSRKWRYNWVRISELVFDKSLFQESTQNQVFNDNKLITTMYQVLLLHRGPILKFTLIVSESRSDIDQVIHFVSRKCVEEFHLYIGGWFYCGELYKLPSSIFSCLQLRHLVLKNCVFKLPPAFNGFSRLISLDFCDVDFDAVFFGDFISSCPLLKELSLEECMAFDFLEIDAPMLKSLSTSSSFNCILFKNTPLLESVDLSSNVAGAFEYQVEGCTSIMIMIFGSLPVIKHLRLGYCFVELLTQGGVPEKLPFTLNHLKCLEFDLFSAGEREEVAVALCLIKSLPNLEEIYIQPYYSIVDDEGHALEFLEVQDYGDFSLNQLRKFDMDFDPESRAEKEFCKLIVANSPSLECQRSMGLKLMSANI